MCVGLSIVVALNFLHPPHAETSGEQMSKPQLEARLKQAQAAVKECYNAWCVRGRFGGGWCI